MTFWITLKVAQSMDQQMGPIASALVLATQFLRQRGARHSALEFSSTAPAQAAMRSVRTSFVGPICSNGEESNPVMDVGPGSVQDSLCRSACVAFSVRYFGMRRCFVPTVDTNRVEPFLRRCATAAHFFCDF